MMIEFVDPDLVFELVRDKLGGFSAHCLNARISATGTDLAAFNDNLTLALEVHFKGGRIPPANAIHLVMYPDDWVPLERPPASGV